MQRTGSKKELLHVSPGRSTMTNESKIQAKFSPPVLLQELLDEALGQLACVTEELLVEVVVHGRDVPKSFLFGLAEERRGSAQTARATRNNLTLTSDNLSAENQS